MDLFNTNFKIEDFDHDAHEKYCAEIFSKYRLHRRMSVVIIIFCALALLLARFKEMPLCIVLLVCVMAFSSAFVAYQYRATLKSLNNLYSTVHLLARAKNLVSAELDVEEGTLVLYTNTHDGVPTNMKYKLRVIHKEGVSTPTISLKNEVLYLPQEADSE